MAVLGGPSGEGDTGLGPKSQGLRSRWMKTPPGKDIMETVIGNVIQIPRPAPVLQIHTIYNSKTKLLQIPKLQPPQSPIAGFSAAGLNVTHGRGPV